MSKITLNPVADLTQPTTAEATINANSATIQTAFDNTLSRDGTSPNKMGAALDMDSNQILNLPKPISNNSPLRLQELIDFTGSGGVSTLPAGGTTGQVLDKKSNADYDVGWTNSVTSVGLSASSDFTVTGSPVTTAGTINLSLTNSPTGTGSFVKQTSPTINNASLSAPTLSSAVLGTPASGSLNNCTNLPLTGLATQGGNTLVGNFTGSAGSPTAATIGSLTIKSTPGASDLVLIQDQAAAGQLKYTTISSIGSSSGVSSIAGNSGAFTLAGGVTNSTNQIQLDGKYTGFANANCTLAASVASNLLTVSVLDNSGATPSTTSPVYFNYRNATATTGSTTLVPQTSALTINTNAVGATLGTANGVGFRFWVVVFNNAGTNVLGLINCYASGTLFALQDSMIVSTTPISGSATSAGVFYTPNGTTLTNVPMKILGYIEYSGGLTTAGTYATSPTLIQAYSAGVKKPGDLIQAVQSLNNSGSSTTSTSMVDVSGTATITPTSTCNAIRYHFDMSAQAGVASGASSSMSTQVLAGSTVLSGPRTVGVFISGGATGAQSSAGQTYRGYTRLNTTSATIFKVQQSSSTASATATTSSVNIILEEVQA